MKKFAWKKCWKMFLEALFFAFEKNFLRVSVQNFGHCRLHEIIGLQLSQCLSADHNPELRCVICTCVTLFAPVLHFLHWCYTRTALLSANQNRLIFSCVLLITKSLIIQANKLIIKSFLFISCGAICFVNLQKRKIWLKLQYITRIFQ